MKSRKASSTFESVGFGMEADNIFLANVDISSDEEEGRREERCRREVWKSTR